MVRRVVVGGGAGNINNAICQQQPGTAVFPQGIEVYIALVIVVGSTAGHSGLDDHGAAEFFCAGSQVKSMQLMEISSVLLAAGLHVDRISVGADDRSGCDADRSRDGTGI